MKKEYTSPSMQVVELKSKQILMGSGDRVIQVKKSGESIDEYDGEFY